MLNKSITVGDIKARSPIALAPMAGVADVPFRQLAWELGAGYMVSEMVSSSDHLWDTDKNRMRRVALSGVFPNVIQIAGCDPKALSESARKVVDEGADIVDINFGCPAKKVCKKLAGSALLDDIALIGCIVEAVAKAVSVPVTFKTRTGITPDDHLGIQAAKIAEESGAQMVVIHSRSRSCRFKGIVDHQKVAELKSILNIPFLVNGDICSEDSAKTALEESLADGVMLGRGAVGQRHHQGCHHDFSVAGVFGEAAYLPDHIQVRARRDHALVHRVVGDSNPLKSIAGIGNLVIPDGAAIGCEARHVIRPGICQAVKRHVQIPVFNGHGGCHEANRKHQKKRRNFLPEAFHGLFPW